MPSFTLLRQDRTLILGDSREFSSVKVSFPPMRYPDGAPIILEAESGEEALGNARQLFPGLKEILLAVEPTTKAHYGNRESRVH